MPIKKEAYRCPACGKVVRALATPWCHCKPGKPFRMIPVSVERAVDKMMGRR